MKKITRFKQLIFGLITAAILCTPQTVFANDIAEDVMYINDVGSNVQSTQGFSFWSYNAIGPVNQIWDPVISAGGLSEWVRFFNSNDTGLVYNGFGYQRYGPNTYYGSDKFYLHHTDPARGVGVLKNHHNHWDANCSQYEGIGNGSYGYTTTNWKRTITSFYLCYQTKVVDGRQVCPKGNIGYPNVPWGEKRALTAPSNAEKTAYTVTFNPAGGTYNNTTANTNITYRYTFNGFSGNIYDLNRNGQPELANIACTASGLTAGRLTRPNNYTCTLEKAQGNFTVPGLSNGCGCSYNGQNAWTYDAITIRNDRLEAQYYRPAIALGTPVRDGYKFKGWKCSDNNAVYTGTSIPADTNATYQGPQGNFTMTAQWEALEYNINYVYNPPAGHTVAEIIHTKKPAKAQYTIPFVVSNPTLKGYIFKGWYITDMSTNTNKIPSLLNGKVNGFYNCGGVANEGIDVTYNNLRTAGGTITFSCYKGTNPDDPDTPPNTPDDPGDPGWTPIKYKVVLDPNK